LEAYNAGVGEIIWKTDTSSVEIRLKGTIADGAPALNEILASGASFHLKRRHHGGWRLEFEAGGRDFHLSFDVSDGALTCSLCEMLANEFWNGEIRDISLLDTSEDAIHPIFLDDEDAGFMMTDIPPEHTGLPFVVWIANGGDARHDIRIWASPDTRSWPSNRTCLAIRPDVRVRRGKLEDHDLNFLRRWVALNLEMIEKHWDGKIGSSDVYETNRPIRP
jgi:hypothetical protein